MTRPGDGKGPDAIASGPLSSGWSQGDSNP